MNDSCRRRETCRLCGGKDLAPVLELTPTPPANAFVGKDALNTEQACFPLDIFFCKTCSHVQLLDVVDPGVLFENYVYVSGTSPSFVKHFEDYADTVVARFQPGPESMVIDIGSNDGTLLSAFKAARRTINTLVALRDRGQLSDSAQRDRLVEFIERADAVQQD